MTTEVSNATVLDRARQARAAAAALARMDADAKNAVLAAVARELRARASEILEANMLDLDSARPRVASGEMAESLYARLKLGAVKLEEIVHGVEQVAALEDPTGRVDYSVELDDGLRLDRVAVPIGVVGVIFESRPDALVQIASLCLKSGNAVLLKGGREAEHSNRSLFDAIRSAAEGAGAPPGALALLESREDVATLLGADRDVDLIIPRGSNALVRYVQENTRIPVLGHAEGVCHVYVDEAADLAKAERIVVDAKVQYPSACNAAETLLVHERVARALLPKVASSLRAAGVELRCDERALEIVGGDAVRAMDDDWDAEYCDLVLSVRVVDSLDEAIAHVNEHGSHHTDAIVTEDESAWERFFASVDSAGVYLNASTRFADGFRYGFGAEVGISTGKLHPRGPVGLEGLVTYKYRLVGEGHVVGDYSGKGGRCFTHRKLDRG